MSKGSKRRPGKGYDYGPTWVEKRYPLKSLTKEDYVQLLRSGMFYEWYPGATGIYSQDTT